MRLSHSQPAPDDLVDGVLLVSVIGSYFPSCLDVMGKGKDKDKKRAHSERTAAKQKQKANKNLLKEVGEESIDKILADLVSHDKQLTTVTVSPPLAQPPSPRSNCTWLPHPTKPLLVLYGGEHYDGRTTHVYNNLYLFDTRKCEWKEVSCPSQPVARSAHQAVVMLRGEGEPLMYAFGGEYQSPSATQFYHFNQLYTLSLDTYHFTLLAPATSPPARSGHRMVGYGGRYLLLFGGFHDDGREIRHFNDLWQFDCRDEEWRCISKEKERKADVDNRIKWPEPRSGFCLWVDEEKDCAYVYGGVTIIKEQKGGLGAGKKGKGGRVVEKEVQLTDLWSLSLSTWQWTSVKRRGIFPNERSGMACAAVSLGGKRRAALFGGVSDERQDKKEKVKGGKDDKKGKSGKKKGRAEEEEEEDDDEDDEEERSIHYNDTFVFNMDTQHFHYANTKGRVITDYQQSVAKKEKDKKEKAAGTADGEDSEEKGDGKESGGSSIFDFNPVLDALPPPPTTSAASATAALPSSSSGVPCPAPRRSAALCVKDGVLWLHSGVIEGAGGREHTYSDIWSLELGRDEWRQVQADVEGEQWLGSDDERDDEEAEAEMVEKKKEDGKEDDVEGTEDTEADADAEESQDGTDDAEADVEQQVADDDETDDIPKVERGESAADYFTRTKDFWMECAQNDTPTAPSTADGEAETVVETDKAAALNSAKELRKAAFELATIFYDESTE